MKNANIICFAKDWSENPTSNNHVMRMLAKHGNKVLWLNSIAMRRPKFTSGRDLRKIFRKLNSFFKGVVKVDENLWVYTPIVLPFPHSKIASRLNFWILKMTLARLRRKLGFQKYQLWTFLPNVVDYIGKLDEELVIYYCIDEWSHFTYLDGEKMSAMEKTLCERADLVFATAKSLLDSKAPFNSRTYLAPHGVDYELFSKALAADCPIATELADVAKPIIGFFGLIHEWIDLELIQYLAEKKPDWNIAIVGKSIIDISSLSKHKNIILIGPKPYLELPQYCKAFNVGIIPFAVNELTVHVNPIKLREYLCAGLPVVSTNLPEVVLYKDMCTIADSFAEFLDGIEREIALDSPELQKQRSDKMKSETWEAKVSEIESYIDKVTK